MILKCKQCGKEFDTTKTRSTKYCSRPCYTLNQFGSKNHFWKGGRQLTQWGYYVVNTPIGHPKRKHRANASKIFEHRLVMENHLGRYLKDGEFVHHINGIKTDNRIENLIVITKAQHNHEHFAGRKGLKRGRFPNQTTYKRDPVTGRFG